MDSLWLIVNGMSHAIEKSVIDEAKALIEGRGVRISRVVDLTNGALPELTEAQPDIIASLGGDGTANAVITQYGRADGPRILALPGGTMNLLARKLHGETGIGDVIERAFAPDARVEKMPQINGPGFSSLVGVIAGQTTAWGQVREDMREGALAALAESVPEALTKTFGGAQIRVNREPEEYAALFFEPGEDGIHAHEILAANIADLARHGWAWLRRDFLGGPTEELERGKTFAITGLKEEIGLLVDGESMSKPSPLTLTWSICPARFITTLRS